MIKWRKIFGNHWLGIWFLGLAFFFVQEIPYMVMPLIHLDTNPLMNMQTEFTALDVLEKIFGSLSIAAMLLIVNGETKWFSLKDIQERVSFIGVIITILLNFLGWGLYFGGYQSIAIMIIFLVAMPPLYYIAIGLWRKNYILAIIGGLFWVFHFSNALTRLL